MRLSEWRAAAPHRDAMSPAVMAVVEPVLATLGATDDPHCWVFWGDDPSIRYLIAVPTGPGLITSHVRVNVPGEGPRAAAKLVRWSRVQVGDLTVETSGAHRLLSAQVEGHVVRAADAGADGAAAFVLAVLGAIDGRPVPDLGASTGAARRPTAGANARVVAPGRAAAAPRRAR